MSKRNRAERQIMDRAMEGKPLRSLEDLKKLQVAKPVPVKPAKRPWWRRLFGR
jgi:hypothetical protein